MVLFMIWQNYLFCIFVKANNFLSIISSSLLPKRIKIELNILLSSGLVISKSVWLCWLVCEPLASCPAWQRKLPSYVYPCHRSHGQRSSGRWSRHIIIEIIIFESSINDNCCTNRTQYNLDRNRRIMWVKLKIRRRRDMGEGGSWFLMLK